MLHRKHQGIVVDRLGMAHRLFPEPLPQGLVVWRLVALFGDPAADLLPRLGNSPSRCAQRSVRILPGSPNLLGPCMEVGIVAREVLPGPCADGPVALGVGHQVGRLRAGACPEGKLRDQARVGEGDGAPRQADVAEDLPCVVIAALARHGFDVSENVGREVSIPALQVRAHARPDALVTGIGDPALVVHLPVITAEFGR